MKTLKLKRSEPPQLVDPGPPLTNEVVIQTHPDIILQVETSGDHNPILGEPQVSTPGGLALPGEHKADPKMETTMNEEGEDTRLHLTQEREEVVYLEEVVETRSDTRDGGDLHTDHQIHLKWFSLNSLLHLCIFVFNIFWR